MPNAPASGSRGGSGPVAPGIALLVLAVAAHVAVRGWQGGEPPAWLGALVVAGGSTVLTLWRPGITPDHPWAERRLVIATCLVVVLVVVAATWLARQSTEATARFGSAAVVLVALLAPALMATSAHARHRVEAGSLAAVRQACAGFESGDVALLVDARGANEWPQVLRGQCGVPSLSTTSALQSGPPRLRLAVDAVREQVTAQGGRLVLVAVDGPDSLTGLGGVAPERLVDATVLEDERVLERRPDALVPLQVSLWAAATTE